jgi:hypothetical protein
MADTPSDPSDFFPMSVHYQERLSAAGRTRYRTLSTYCPCVHQLSSVRVFHSLYSYFWLNTVAVSLNEKEGQKTTRFIIRTFTTLLCYVCQTTRVSFLLHLQVLVCRLIDRPLRPTMPKGFYYETQILSWVIQCFFLYAYITYTIILVCRYCTNYLIFICDLYCSYDETIISYYYRFSVMMVFIPLIAWLWQLLV